VNKQPQLFTGILVPKHVALRARNSGAESGRELFKGLKDAAGHLVCTPHSKKFLVGECGIFWVTA